MFVAWHAVAYFYFILVCAIRFYFVTRAVRNSQLI
jgi:hypothetical protein